MGGFAARVVADLQELVEIDGDATRVMRPASMCGRPTTGRARHPVGEVLLPAPGRLALAPDAEAPLIPVLPDIRG
jgi:hypothetical protein